jgi:hypothetical protein
MLTGFALLRAELQHAHFIMSLFRMKLLQYYTLLQRSFLSTASAEGWQALDGLHEISYSDLASHL